MVYGLIPPQTSEKIVASPVPIPIGSMSRDRSAVVGADGHLYILEGTNSLFAQYAEPETEDARRTLELQVAAWQSLLERRATTSAALGARFIQIFVPDKSSSLDSGIPALGRVTPLLDRLEKSFRGDAPYVSGRAELARAGTIASLSDQWLRLDSHTSARGSLTLSRALVNRVGDASFMDDVSFVPSGTFTGDLGARFFGNPVPEPDVQPRSSWLDAVATDRDLVARHYPERGHTGLTLHWRTPYAPLDAKVLVFGNSFFGGGDLPRGLNFWVSRAFREHRFVWSAEMLEDEIRATRPDVVICQTVERFMGTVPAR